MKTKICELCHRNITVNNYGKHISSCEKNKKIKTEDFSTKVNDNLYTCNICGKEYCQKGMASHIWRMHTEIGKNHKPAKEGAEAWNKGLTKESNEIVAKYAKTIKKKYDSGEIKPNFLGKKHTEETRKKIGEKLSKNNNGGRCKWYSFKRKNGEITKVQGTWEYRFASILEEIDEGWIKNSGQKEHTYAWIDKNDKEHFYTPDFYSPKLKKYFEVKGYWWGNDEEKMEYVKEQYQNIVFDIIRKKELEKYEDLFNLPHKMVI